MAPLPMLPSMRALSSGSGLPVLPALSVNADRHEDHAAAPPGGARIRCAAVRVRPRARSACFVVDGSGRALLARLATQLRTVGLPPALVVVHRHVARRNAEIRRALKHEQSLGLPGDHCNGLDARRAGADHADALAGGLDAFVRPGTGVMRPAATPSTNASLPMGIDSYLTIRYRTRSNSAWQRRTALGSSLRIAATLRLR